MIWLSDKINKSLTRVLKSVTCDLCDEFQTFMAKNNFDTCPTLYNNVSISNEFFVCQMWWWVFCMINLYEFWYLEITINTSCIIITCLTTSKTDNASKYKATPSGSPELSSLLERFLVATLDIYLVTYFTIVF